MPALGLLVLRLTLSAVLIAHGLHQLFGLLAGPGVGAGGLSATTAYFQALGLTPSFAMAVASGAIQAAGGLLIGVGWLTRLSAVLVVVHAAVLIWKDHARWGFFLNWVLDPMRGHGFELSLIVIGTALCLVISGAGDWSVDGQRQRSAASRASARARIRG